MDRTIKHKDGREWTAEEFTEFIRADREHDDLWPYEAKLWAVAIPAANSPHNEGVYLLDNIQTWHQLMEDVVYE